MALSKAASARLGIAALEQRLGQRRLVGDLAGAPPVAPQDMPRAPQPRSKPHAMPAESSHHCLPTPESATETRAMQVSHRMIGLCGVSRKCL